MVNARGYMKMDWTKTMTDDVRRLFERWDRVWHDRQYDLIHECLGSHYIRHDEKGEGTQS